MTRAAPPHASTTRDDRSERALVPQVVAACPAKNAKHQGAGRTARAVAGGVMTTAAHKQVGWWRHARGEGGSATASARPACALSSPSSRHAQGSPRGGTRAAAAAQRRARSASHARCHAAERAGAPQVRARGRARRTDSHHEGSSYRRTFDSSFNSNLICTRHVVLDRPTVPVCLPTPRRRPTPMAEDGAAAWHADGALLHWALADFSWDPDALARRTHHAPHAHNTSRAPSAHATVTTCRARRTAQARAPLTAPPPCAARCADQVALPADAGAGSGGAEARRRAGAARGAAAPSQPSGPTAASRCQIACCGVQLSTHRAYNQRNRRARARCGHALACVRVCVCRAARRAASQPRATVPATPQTDSVRPAPAPRRRARQAVPGAHKGG
jgi:hypothetical protein